MEAFYYLEPELQPQPKRLLLYGRKRALADGSISVCRVTVLGDLEVGETVEAATEHWEYNWPSPLPSCPKLKILDISQEALRYLFENPGYAMDELALEGMPPHMSVAERISELMRVSPHLRMDTPVFRITFEILQ